MRRRTRRIVDCPVWQPPSSSYTNNNTGDANGTNGTPRDSSLPRDNRPTTPRNTLDPGSRTLPRHFTPHQYVSFNELGHSSPRNVRGATSHSRSSTADSISPILNTRQYSVSSHEIAQYPPTLVHQNSLPNCMASPPPGPRYPEPLTDQLDGSTPCPQSPEPRTSHDMDLQLPIPPPPSPPTGQTPKCLRICFQNTVLAALSNLYHNQPDHSQSGQGNRKPPLRLILKSHPNSDTTQRISPSIFMPLRVQSLTPHSRSEMLKFAVREKEFGVEEWRDLCRIVDEHGEVEFQVVRDGVLVGCSVSSCNRTDVEEGSEAGRAGWMDRDLVFVRNHGSWWKDVGRKIRWVGGGLFCGCFGGW